MLLAAVLSVSGLGLLASGLVAILAGSGSELPYERVALASPIDRVMLAFYTFSGLITSIGSFGWMLHVDEPAWMEWAHAWVIACLVACAGLAASYVLRFRTYGKRLQVLAMWTPGWTAATFVFVVTLQSGMNPYCIAAAVHAVCALTAATMSRPPFELFVDAVLADDAVLQLAVRAAQK